MKNIKGLLKIQLLVRIRPVFFFFFKSAKHIGLYVSNKGLYRKVLTHWKFLFMLLTHLKCLYFCFKCRLFILKHFCHILVSTLKMVSLTENSLSVCRCFIDSLSLTRFQTLLVYHLIFGSGTGSKLVVMVVI